MPNAWTEHVKQFALKNGISYGCALSMPECKATYKKIVPIKEKETFSKNENLNEYMKTLKEKKPEKIKPIKLGKQVKLSLDDEDEDLSLGINPMDAKFRQFIERYRNKDKIRGIVEIKRNIEEKKTKAERDFEKNFVVKSLQKSKNDDIAIKKFQDFVKRAKAKKNKFITPRLINYKLEESDYLEPEQSSWKPFSLKLDMKLKGKKLEKADEELQFKINNLPDDIRRTVKTEYFNINDMNARIKKAEEEIKGVKKEKESTRLRITKRLEEDIKEYEREITNSKNILRNMGFEI